jgi:hypothetical protein
MRGQWILRELASFSSSRAIVEEAVAIDAAEAAAFGERRGDELQRF